MLFVVRAYNGHGDVVCEYHDVGELVSLNTLLKATRVLNPTAVRVVVDVELDAPATRAL